MFTVWCWYYYWLRVCSGSIICVLALAQVWACSGVVYSSCGSSSLQQSALVRQSTATVSCGLGFYPEAFELLRPLTLLLLFALHRISTRRIPPGDLISCGVCRDSAAVVSKRIVNTFSLTLLCARLQVLLLRVKAVICASASWAILCSSCCVCCLLPIQL